MRQMFKRDMLIILRGILISVSLTMIWLLWATGLLDFLGYGIKVIFTLLCVDEVFLSLVFIKRL